MLYKYVIPERVDIIQNMKIRFTPYDELNDPFECRFVLNPIPEEQEEAEADENNAEWAQVEVWLKFRMGQLGLLCLTREPNNFPMWAHYAENHKGFVICLKEQHSFFNAKASYIEPAYQLNTVIESEGFGTLRDVTYTRERTSINLGDNIPFDFFFKKHRDWAYEREVRIFRTLRDGVYIPEKEMFLFDLPPGLLQRVILGINASTETEQQILDAIHKNNLGHVKIDRARLHRRNFDIVYETLHNPQDAA